MLAPGTRRYPGMVLLAGMKRRHVMVHVLACMMTAQARNKVTSNASQGEKSNKITRCLQRETNAENDVCGRAGIS